MPTRARKRMRCAGERGRPIPNGSTGISVFDDAKAWDTETMRCRESFGMIALAGSSGHQPNRLNDFGRSNGWPPRPGSPAVATFTGRSRGAGPGDRKNAKRGCRSRPRRGACRRNRNCRLSSRCFQVRRTGDRQRCRSPKRVFWGFAVCFHYPLSSFPRRRASILAAGAAQSRRKDYGPPPAR